MQKLGFVGAGQLARMSIPFVYQYGAHPIVLGPSGSTAFAPAEAAIRGSIQNGRDLANLVAASDIVTFEIESVDVAALQAAVEQAVDESQNARSVVLRPSLEIIKLIQNKISQKNFLKQEGFPVGKFETFANRKAFDSAPKSNGFIKAAYGGYDGRGVCRVQNLPNVQSDYFPEEVELLWEAEVELANEFAILVARNSAGQIEAYPPVEVVTNSALHQMDHTVFPATVLSEAQSKKAVSIAKDLALKLKLEGLLAIEFFLTVSGDVLINELAPRVHNTGHHSLHSCNVSQFEQQVRAVLGFPLLPVVPYKGAITANIIGAEEANGQADFSAQLRINTFPDCHLVLYGKEQVKPGRKLGHVTIVGSDLGTMQKRLAEIRPWLKVPAK